MPSQKLILASGSPRRRELLAEAGYEFEVVAPSEAAERAPRDGEDPAELVAELARGKADDVAARVRSGTLVAADTVAACEGQILGKPADRAHARRMLELLAGREHRVYSGLCVWPLPDGMPETRVAVTTLRMERLSDAQLEEYLDGGQWRGKAGAFGYQDRHGWLHIVAGSESNVVGLPLELLAEMLGRAEG
jgi:septum formation protein